MRGGALMEQLFWKASLEDLKKGYIYDQVQQSYICLICGKVFERGYIYPFEERFMDAERAAIYHLEREHSSMFEFLISMGKKYTGLTPHQSDLIRMLYKGYRDKEIVEKTGANSTSTIRNQRFSFREKEKQARVYLAIAELLNEKMEASNNNQNDRFIDIHRGATMVDERYVITEQERQNVLKTHFEQGGLKLKSFPAREKKKIVVLQQVAKQFSTAKIYTEKEVNTIIQSFYEDYVTIRRYLIQYGFLERTADCKEYWVKH